MLAAGRARLVRTIIRVLGTTLFLYLAALALYSSAPPGHDHRAIAWDSVARADLITAALYLDVQEGGPGLALAHLDRLAARDSTMRVSGHMYAHAIGRYAVERRWDPRVYAACTPHFEAGCFHGVMEAYLAHIPRPSQDQISSLCDSISGGTFSEVMRRECAHGLGHGLWFRMREQALGYCDGLTTPAAQEECRDGVFMQRATERMALHGAPTEHHHHADDVHGVQILARQQERGPSAFTCQDETPRYQHACWHYQGRLLLLDAAQNYGRAFEGCDRAPELYRNVCYWGMGKWIAAHVGQVADRSERILERCGHGREALRGACVAGAVESLIDENWTLESAAELCQAAPANSKLPCYEKLGERVGILYADGGEVAVCATQVPVDFRPICQTAAIRERSRDRLGPRVNAALTGPE
jgi:hypothetical protein